MVVPMSILQIFTLALSVLAVGVSYYAATRTYRSGLRPFLIFYNSEFDSEEETSWTLENAGSGPAINVVVAGDNHLVNAYGDEADMMATQRADAWLFRLRTISTTS